MAWRTFSFMLCLIAAGTVVAQTPPQQQGWFGRSLGTVCPPYACAPDDYCRKPLPTLCPEPRCHGADDYCRKPLPCLGAVPRDGSCDDYCRKPLPTLLCPPLLPYLNCGPSARPPANR